MTDMEVTPQPPNPSPTFIDLRNEVQATLHRWGVFPSLPQQAHLANEIAMRASGVMAVRPAIGREEPITREDVRDIRRWSYSRNGEIDQDLLKRASYALIDHLAQQPLIAALRAEHEARMAADWIGPNSDVQAWRDAVALRVARTRELHEACRLEFGTHQAARKNIGGAQ